ncbi:MAG: hypothetical protein LBT56_05410 [Prevotellaceae bacterium]|jgi:hypothetical protein|nr:hypothetical protein [Prevotellaceae bacterium]
MSGNDIKYGYIIHFLNKEFDKAAEDIIKCQKIDTGEIPDFIKIAYVAHSKSDETKKVRYKYLNEIEIQEK